MIHPLLRKLVTHPALFVEHASGYAELAALEAQAMAQSWRRRLVWLVAAALLTAAALVLSGMAALLAAALPTDQMPQPLLLLALPLGAWVLAALCAWAGARQGASAAFGHLREQWAADMQLVRAVDADPT